MKSVKHKTKKIAKKAKKAVKKRLHKFVAKKQAKVVLKGSKKVADMETRSARLVSRGKERGFVTYDEILREFPTVEDDVIFLDDLYSRLAAANVDVLEGGGILDMGDDHTKLIGGRSGDAAYDSIQIYLKEIGQYPLIPASQEKELAKRIEKNDAEVKNFRRMLLGGSGRLLHALWRIKAVQFACRYIWLRLLPNTSRL